jgi:A/G-specific adenine glycosylase
MQPVPNIQAEPLKKNVPLWRNQLIDWYMQNRRRLPWRSTADPYHIWIAEVMLQQTQVNTVLPYYRRFLDRFPALPELARADLEEVLKVWEGLGYYGRARHLHLAAGIVFSRHQGVIPNTWNDLRRLPGVGDYIAAAVLSIAFGQPYAVVDGNVKRVLSRLLLLDEPVNRSTKHRIFQTAADGLLDPDQPGIFNQALMELGAMVCKPRQPHCDRCPLEKTCPAHRFGWVAEYPKRVKQPSPPVYPIAVGVVFKNSRVLITRRKPEGLLGGLWEFPGGRIQNGETPADACIREIKEEVNLTVEIEAWLTRVKHAYTHFKIIMEVFCCRYISGRVRLQGPVDHRWLELRQLDDYPFPKANHKFIGKLKELPRSAEIRSGVS